MRYNIDFVICALVITVVTMTYYYCSTRLNDRQGKMFALLGIVLTLACALDIATVLLDGRASDVVLYVVNMAFLLCLNVLPCLLLVYMLTITGGISLNGWKVRTLIWLPFAVEFALLIMSPVNGRGFYIENRHYSQGPCAFTAYAAAAAYIAASAVVAVRARKHFPSRRFTAVMVFIIIELSAVAVQYFVPKALLTEFAAALSLLIMYVSMQSPEQISDPVTNAYNMAAMNTMVAERFSRREHFIIFGYSVDGLRQINELYGETVANDFLKFIVRELSSAFGGSTARLYGAEFFVLTDTVRTAAQAQEAADKLPGVWNSGKYEIDFTAARVILDSGTFHSASEMLELMDFAIKYARSGENAPLVIVDGEVREKYYRREQVKSALRDAVNEGRVQVFYQPIVEASTGRINAAEALVRISDPKLGALLPSEFIPIAEQSGIIIELGKCVREKVWELLREYDIRAAGLDHICVNLSALECTQRSVMEAILEEQRRAGTESGLMDLEITETAAIASEDALYDNMALMRENGFTFHLDDYGTGYSSMQNLISLPFEVVKIDRSIVGMADDERRGRLVRRMIFPFHGYGIKVVCEGIETEAQSRMVRSWGTDFIQGYYYSRPLPQEAFLKFAGIRARSIRE